jgi:predicted AAA+ superfamily ATPase
MLHVLSYRGVAHFDSTRSVKWELAGTRRDRAQPGKFELRRAMLRGSLDNLRLERDEVLLDPQGLPGVIAAVGASRLVCSSPKILKPVVCCGFSSSRVPTFANHGAMSILDMTKLDYGQIVPRPRYLRATLARVLDSRKMAFVGGPRQVGKTTMALGFLGEDADEQHPGYLNWDDPRMRPPMRRAELPVGEPVLVFDEIHKYARWRNLLKGIWDTEKSRRRIIVTGSARLDYYRKGGDSLAGRYRYFRLHPFSLREWDEDAKPSSLDELLRFGGFPEPLFGQDETEHRIWQRDRLSRVVREDLRDLERVREISLVEHLVDLLPERVGAPLSIANLRQDLEVDHKTVERWLQILENLYVCFRVAPYGVPRIRAVKKERKLYLWDWSSVADSGARFENLVASQLLKYCHLLEDVEGRRMELRYLRDRDKREVDFVVLRDGRPLFAVECKTGDRAVSGPVRYFAERTPIPRFYQVHRGDRRLESGKIVVLPFTQFCMDLGMP